MADYTQGTWTDDDGSGTTGTAVTKARMDNIEGGVKDAAEHHKRGSWASRPAAAAGNKNWLYTVTDDVHQPTFRSTGAAWEVVAWKQRSLGLTVWDRSQAALAAHSRTGNVLTASANGSINSTAAFNGAGLQVGDLVLVKDETAENGVYVVTAVGAAGAAWVLTRYALMDATADLRQYMTVVVGAPTARIGEIWQLDTLIATTPAPTINTTTLTFTNHGLIAWFGYKLDFMADINSGVIWPLTFDPDTQSGVNYMWLADGDPTPLRARTDTENQGGGTFSATNFANGPDIYVPLAGDFMLGHGCWVGLELEDRYGEQFFYINGSSRSDLTDARCIMQKGYKSNSSKHTHSIWREDRINALPVGTLSARYSGIWAYFAMRTLLVRPVRVGPRV